MSPADLIVALQRYEAICAKYGKPLIDQIIKDAASGTKIEADVNRYLFNTSVPPTDSETPPSNPGGTGPSDEMDVSKIKWDGAKLPIVCSMSNARQNGKSSFDWQDMRSGDWELTRLKDGRYFEAVLWTFVVRGGTIIAARGIDKVGRNQHHKGQENIWQASSPSNPYRNASLRPRAGDIVGLCLVSSKNQRRTNVTTIIWK
jgi:hypothetical protein